ARDRTVRFWDPLAGQPHVLLGAGAARALGASVDGRWLATGAAGGEVRLWDVDAGKSSALGSAGAEIRELAFAPDGARFVPGRGRARLLSGTRGPFASVACSTQLVAAGHNDGVTLWRVSSGVPTPLFAAGGPYTSLAFTPDGKQLVGRGERGARVWDVVTGVS